MPAAPANPRITEPVVLLALVQDELQAADPQTKQAEADAIELAGNFLAGRLGVFEELALQQ